MKRVYLDYCNDILEAITDIESFVAGLTCARFFEDHKCRNAVVRNLEIIRETAKNIPDALRSGIRMSRGNGSQGCGTS